MKNRTFVFTLFLLSAAYGLRKLRPSINNPQSGIVGIVPEILDGMSFYIYD